MPPPLDLLLAVSALAAALMAGVYFAFSAFIMTAFAELERGAGPGAGAAAMNAINRVILRSAFMPLFWGSTLASLALAVLALLDRSAPGSAAQLGGGALYVVGMFGVTAAFNVPLNNRLPAAMEGGAVWAHYLRAWTRWNHVRTLACFGAATLFLIALSQ